MLLKWFLKDKVADKAIYASKDKSLLISRMIFILGISDDESFFEEYKEDGSKLDYLKNYIKKYKTIEVPTYNSRYLLKGLFKWCFWPSKQVARIFFTLVVCAVSLHPETNINLVCLIPKQTLKA